MENIYKASVASVLLAGAVLFTSLNVGAQALWLSPDHEATFSIEAVKPFFKSDSGLDDAVFFSSAVNFNVRLPANDVFLITAELPVSYYDLKDGDIDNNLSLGNPYIGAEARPAGDLFFGEVGVRIPVVDNQDYGVISGSVGDIGRMDAYVPERWCVAGFANVMYRPEEGSGLTLRARFGPVLSIYSGDSKNVDDTETFLAYGGQIWYSHSWLTAGVGIFARTWVSESDVTNRTVEHMGLSLTADAGVVRPGIQLRVPLDQELNDASGVAVGFHLTLPVNRP